MQVGCFLNLRWGDDGASSSSYGRHFSTLLKSIHAKPSKKTFHSFRHTFVDACREAGISEEVFKELVGHGGGVTSRYGGYSIVKRDEWLQRVDYSGLVLR